MSVVILHFWNFLIQKSPVLKKIHFLILTVTRSYSPWNEGSLLNTKLVFFFSLTSWQEKVWFWYKFDDDIYFVLNKHGNLDFYSDIVQWLMKQYITADMLLQSDTLSWLQSNKILLLIGVCLVEGGLWCFNATFNNISAISWQPVLLMEETGVPSEKNHRPATSHWQTLSHNVV